MNEWIPVEQGLPGDGVSVIFSFNIFDGNSFVVCAGFYKARDFSNGSTGLKSGWYESNWHGELEQFEVKEKVTHWMLPEPPDSGFDKITEQQSDCSFCGKKKDEVNRLIVGPGAAICNECVQLSAEIMTEPEAGE